MSYTPRGKAPEVSRAQAERLNRWWEWKRQRDELLREACSLFAAGEIDRALALDAQAQAMPEPGI